MACCNRLSTLFFLNFVNHGSKTGLAGADTVYCTMPHILFISPQPFFQWRGSPIRVRFVLKALGESGHHVDLLTLPFGEDEQIDNVRIIRVANVFGTKNIAIGPSLLKLGFDVILFFKAIALLRRNKYDIIHGIEEAGFLAVILAKLFRISAVFEKHSDPFSYRRGMIKNFVLSMYTAVEAFTVQHVDLVISTGPGLTAQVLKMGARCPVHTIFDMSSSKVEADPVKTAVIREQIRENLDEILVTYVGSFAVYQGIDLMFETIPLVRAESTRIRFVIIGGTSEEIADRKKVLEKQGVAEKVTFLGKVAPDELPNYLAASDILLAPRLSGVNTPLKILDYFKSGRAIVATDVSANQSILNEATAVFAQPNAASLAEKILQLAVDEDQRNHIGHNGKWLYEQKYNFAAFQRRIEEAYGELDVSRSALN